MKKSFVMLLALTGTVLVSCTQSEYLGEAVQTSDNSAIVFGGATGKQVRAFIENGEAADKLGNEMLVYGVKGDGTNYNDVFKNYTVKYLTSKSGNDEYNNGWYYVEAVSGQSIKYWDYSTNNYRFVAGSPVAKFTFNQDPTSKSITSATVSGLGGHIARNTGSANTWDAVYIADPQVVAKADYNNPVKFEFKAMQSKVRVGIYETIPGYKITDIKFYQTTDDPTPDADGYVTLIGVDNYFQGTTSTVSGTITYDWTATPATYTFDYDASLTKSAYWEGGKFADGVKATSSAGTNVLNLYGADGDLDAATGYFVVMPTPSATEAKPLTLKCDYTLTSLDAASETIKVKGATATIPSAYTKWAPNTAYTYIFKITKNTNGSTGGPDDPEGLYPIKFDAVVVEVADGMLEGTETTVSTPSITVYQDGDVVAEGIKFKAGDVEVKAMVGTTELADADVEWSNYVLDGTSFDYTKAYEAQGTFASGKVTTVEASKTYVIKAVYTNSEGKTFTAYFVLVVGAAEDGPGN